MVFRVVDLSAIFAAADANDQTLNTDIWSAHGGEDLATYAQCRRRYKAYKKSADADEADAEEEAEPATPAAAASLFDPATYLPRLCTCLARRHSASSTRRHRNTTGKIGRAHV